MAQVDGGYSSGTWGEAGWGCSVYYPIIAYGGWGTGTWGQNGWGFGAGFLSISDQTNVAANAPILATFSETVTTAEDYSAVPTLSGAIDETVTTADTVASGIVLGSSISETANASETVTSDRKSTRLNSSHVSESRMPSSA